MAPRRSWAKANSPFWSAHVAAWYRSALKAEDYCRRRDLSTATLLLWARHLVSPEDLRKRTEHLRNLRRETPERQVEKGRSKRRKRPSLSLQRADGQRSDCSSRVLEHAY